MKKHIALTAATMVAIWGGGAAIAAQDPAASGTKPAAIERPARFELADAAPSIEVLLDRLLVALADKDAQALRRLRVTEDEYRRFVIPGSVDAGTPPQAIDDQSSKFYWDMLNTKSVYAEQAILKGFGGRRYALKDVRYDKGQRQYAWYRAYRATTLTLEDDSGETHELSLGSIADIDGQYKFIGLLGDR